MRAYASPPDRSQALLEQPLRWSTRPATRWDARGHLRGGWIEYEQPPLERGVPGGGTVHHVAWAIPLGAEQQWLDRVTEAGAQTSGLIDRFYFRSIYFREPSGILFELATMGPGFTVDEDPAHLGECVALPPFLEPIRERIEAALTPLDGVGRQRSRVALAGLGPGAVDRVLGPLERAVGLGERAPRRARAPARPPEPAAGARDLRGGAVALATAAAMRSRACRARARRARAPAAAAWRRARRSRSLAAPLRLAGVVGLVRSSARGAVGSRSARAERAAAGGIAGPSPLSRSGLASRARARPPVARPGRSPRRAASR